MRYVTFGYLISIMSSCEYSYDHILNVGVTAWCLVYVSVTYSDVTIMFRIIHYNRLVLKNSKCRK